EEEGQKLKSASVTVHVASDVAIYTLNQKRRELARIESDYGMTIAFEPKEGLMAGSFEVERTAQKTPEETAKLAATLKTEPAPVPVEEEPEIAVEEDEQEQADEELAAPSQPHARAEQEQAGGAQSSKRRRRRRGGRGHGDRDRPHNQQPHGHTQPQHQPPVPT